MKPIARVFVLLPVLLAACATTEERIEEARAEFPVVFEPCSDMASAGCDNAFKFIYEPPRLGGLLPRRPRR